MVFSEIKFLRIGFRPHLETCVLREEDLQLLVEFLTWRSRCSKWDVIGRSSLLNRDKIGGRIVIFLYDI